MSPCPPRPPTIPSPSASNLTWESRLTSTLSADSAQGRGPRQVRGAHFSRVLPTPVSNPSLLAATHGLAAELGLTEDFLSSPDFPKVFSGAQILPGMDPYALCYGGHQFGHWAGQLGDGRAINLGELQDQNGVSQNLQLKGCGPTPYSRSADGWAVLRSSLREFLCSEAMHHLGVPTTRALSLVLTGDQIQRDMFYDGNAKMEPGATVCRVAPSFLRFGSFEIFASRGEETELRALADFVLRENYPHLLQPGQTPQSPHYLAFFQELCQKTAQMILHWSRVGFVHGVMNTDNLSILGLTIDYGPYGWLEDYDPSWTPNTTDAGGRRYAFGNQSQIGLWNLLKLANAILPLVEDVEALQAALGQYAESYDRGWEEMMARKMGLLEWNEATDSELTKSLLELLSKAETDWTLFFRCLAQIPAQQTGFAQDLETLRPALYESSQVTEEYRGQLAAWLDRYHARLALQDPSDAERAAQMNRVNPLYVLRNYLAQLAIDDAEKGDLAKLHELQQVLQSPYQEQPGKEHLAGKRPEWAKNRAGCSTLSCSS